MTLDDAALEALLSAAVLRGHRADLDGEQRAVAAYRAARAAGAHRARSRRRDDWRPRAQRRLALSVKTTLSLFVASLALGGVAVAAIGSSDDPADDKVGSTPTAGAPDRPSAEPSAAVSGTRGGRPGHPATAQDTEAKCRAYDQVEGNGKALDSTAWQRLVTAAGGEDRVAAYCAEQLARAAKNGPTKTEPSKSDPTKSEPTKTGPTKTAGGGATGNGQGSSGKNTSGGSAEKTEKAEKKD
ncbi:hypothetical protein AQJ67_27135 [Streptomyces caeruleatus]|uniref:Uncharacterized protein n=2 Tax=Streptomyces caeruleatus TaxID=661399 RepID=A0A101TV34_9ACTN|nr:hypothetical protein AQJ67_27135 [Streptomyces caeruleatus]